MIRHLGKAQGIASLFACVAVAITLSSCSSSSSPSKPSTPRLSTAISEEIVISESPDVPTTAEVYAEAHKRGFGDVDVISAYDMNNKLHDDAVLDPDSDERRPLYYFVYTTDDDYQWCVYVCNGAYSATPMYIYEMERGVEVYVEDDYYTAYNSTTGKFYRNDLATAEVNAIKVDSVDAKTLERLTKEVVIPS